MGGRWLCPHGGGVGGLVAWLVQVSGLGSGAGIGLTRLVGQATCFGYRRTKGECSLEHIPSGLRIVGLCPIPRAAGHGRLKGGRNACDGG
jgi:hypothetical protein